MIASDGVHPASRAEKFSRARRDDGAPWLREERGHRELHREVFDVPRSLIAQSFVAEGEEVCLTKALLE